MPALFDADNPWGKLQPQGWQRRVIRLCHKLPAGNTAAYGLNKGLRGFIKNREPRYFDVRVLDLQLRLLTRGNYCETTALFAPQFFDCIEFEWLKAALQGRSTFIDVGGNVGLYSLVAARHNAQTQIITIEPDRQLIKRMQFNAACNQLNIESVPVALSDYSGAGVLDTSASESGQNQLLAQQASQNAGEEDADKRIADAVLADKAPALKSASTSHLLDVEVTTLIEVCRSRNIETIDLMKIDIEGHEYKVLKHFIEQAPADLYPKRIIIEHVHDADGVMDILRQQGNYRVAATSRRNSLLEYVADS